jgi:uncharacterized protein YjiK
MKRRLFLLTFLILAISCSSGKYSPSIRFPCEWPGSPGFAGDIDRQNIVEPSGVCFHPSRKTLFVVSDEGDIFEIKTDGTPLARLKIPGDLEEVTVDPQSGLLYIVIEGEDVILEFDPEKWQVTRRFPVNREFGGDPNFLQKQVDRYDNGIESLAFVADKNHPEGGTFYAGNQEDPPCIMEILVPLKSSQAEVAEARILRVLPFKMDDPGAMYYDYRKGLLNVVNDADNILVEITLEGKLVREYAFPGDTQEGLTRDDEGYIYIAQDKGGIIKLKDLRR